MSSKHRTPKSTEQKLRDLDAHLFLLREHLSGLRQSGSHLKGIAAELRTLVCRSSGTEGLLWRLTEDLSVSDSVALHLPGKVNLDHPFTQGLQILFVPIARAGFGDPHWTPSNYSLREVIKAGEAIVAAGKPLTHEYLIKAIAQQMGSAHEDDGLEPALTQLSGVFLNGVEPYVRVLAINADLVLEVGERILEAAEAKEQFRRVPHRQGYGDVSFAVRLQRKEHVGGRIELLRARSFTSDVAVTVFAAPTGMLFQLRKRGRVVEELLAAYPSSAELGGDVIGVLSYCSRTGEARTLNGVGASKTCDLSLGWLHSADLVLQQSPGPAMGFAQLRFATAYERLLSSADVRFLLDLDPNAYADWRSNGWRDQGTFPD